MSRASLSMAAVALVWAAGAPADGVHERGSRTTAIVDHVADGDTIEVVVGGREEYIRFIGIDTPEVYDGVECGGRQASALMKRMVQPGDRVTLVRDPSQGNRDTYERLLRYVEFEGRDLGQRQVSKGWASVYVFDEDFARLGPYRRAAEGAEEANRGAWRRCGGF